MADPAGHDAALAAPCAPDGFPRIAHMGLSGMLVSFCDTLTEPANRAALAFRAALEREGWDGVEESSTSLASVYLRFEPLALSHAALRAKLTALLAARDWHQAPLPEGRRLWRIPTAYGGVDGPQLGEAAARAGMTADEAAADLAAAQVRVLTIGFGPGQPYLGALPPAWDMPRQSALTAQVPQGALVVAIRQFVLFSAPNPTGWRHVGRCAFRCFRPEAQDPFPLRPGDEARFIAVSAEEMANMRAAGADGATAQALS
jgi:KipI family sensor histidine kinase inhibitor